MRRRGAWPKCFWIVVTEHHRWAQPSSCKGASAALSLELTRRGVIVSSYMVEVHARVWTDRAPQPSRQAAGDWRCLLKLLGRTVKVCERSPSIDAKRTRIFFQWLALRLIVVVVEVCQRRLTFACRNDPDGSEATVRTTVLCLRVAEASFGR